MPYLISLIQISSSSPYFQTPPIYVLPLVWETKLHVRFRHKEKYDRWTRLVSVNTLLMKLHVFYPRIGSFKVISIRSYSQYRTTIKKKVKFSATGRGGPRGSGWVKTPDFRHYKGGRLSAKRTGRLYPRRNPWYSLSKAESTSGHMVLSGVPRKKSPVTPPGIDPGTVRLEAHCLKHCATITVLETSSEVILTVPICVTKYNKRVYQSTQHTFIKAYLHVSAVKG